MRRALLVLALLLLIGPAFARWNDAWQYRRTVTISNDTGSTLTDFQVKVVVDTASLIAEGEMNPDCSDMRFVDSDDTTELPYWIERGCGTSETVVWVKVPEIPAGGTTIYMYYGNPSATDAQDPKSVFELFDDFDDGALDSAMWSTYVDSGGTVTESGGYAIIDASGGIAYLYSVGSFSAPIIVRAKIKMGGANMNWGLGAPQTDVYTDAIVYSHDSTPNLVAQTKADGSAWNVIDIGAGDTENYHTAEIRWTDVDAVFYWDDSQVAVSSTYIPTVGLYIEFRTWSTTTGPIYVDWVAVRKYADPEPTATFYTVSISHTPTAQPDLALDPENNITEVNVTWTVDVNTPYWNNLSYAVQKELNVGYKEYPLSTCGDGETVYLVGFYTDNAGASHAMLIAADPDLSSVEVNTYPSIDKFHACAVDGNYIYITGSTYVYVLDRATRAVLASAPLDTTFAPTGDKVGVLDVGGQSYLLAIGHDAGYAHILMQAYAWDGSTLSSVAARWVDARACPSGYTPAIARAPVPLHVEANGVFWVATGYQCKADLDDDGALEADDRVYIGRWVFDGTAFAPDVNYYYDMYPWVPDAGDEQFEVARDFATDQYGNLLLIGQLTIDSWINWGFVLDIESGEHIVWQVSSTTSTVFQRAWRNYVTVAIPTYTKYVAKIWRDANGQLEIAALSAAAPTQYVAFPHGGDYVDPLRHYWYLSGYVAVSSADYNTVLSAVQLDYLEVNVYDGNTYVDTIREVGEYKYISTYTAVGDYTFRAVYDLPHAQGEATDTVHIDMYPQGVDFDWTPSIGFNGEEFTFVGEATDNGTLTYSWSPDLGGIQLSPSSSWITYDTIDVTDTAELHFTFPAGTLSDTHHVGLFQDGVVRVEIEFQTDGDVYLICSDGTVNSTLLGTSADGNWTLVYKRGEYAEAYKDGTLLARCTANVPDAVLHPWFYIPDVGVSFSLKYDNKYFTAASAAGTYTVTMTVTDDVGLSKSITKDVPVYTTPLIVSTREDTTLSLEVIPDSRLTATATWRFPDANITTTGNPAVVYLQEEKTPTGTVEYTLSDGTNVRTLEDNIPVANITYNITTGFRTALSDSATIETNGFDTAPTCTTKLNGVEVNLTNIVFADGDNVVEANCVGGNKEAVVIDNMYMVVKNLSLIDERTKQDTNLAALSSCVIKDIDAGTQYDLKANNRTQIYYENTKDAHLRLEFTIPSIEDIIGRDLYTEYLRAQDTICAGDATQYQIIVSSVEKPVVMRSVYAGCLVLADTTHYAYTTGLMAKAYTTDALYYLYTYDGNALVLLATIDGSLANTINIDALKYTKASINLAITSDAVSIEKVDTNIVRIAYLNLQKNNTYVVLRIYDNTKTYVEHLETESPNDFTVYITTAEVPSKGLLTLEIEAHRTNGDVAYIRRLFTMEGQSGTIAPEVAVALAILIILFTLTAFAVKWAFGPFGILGAVTALLVLANAPQVPSVLFMEAITVLSLFYIIITYRAEGATVT